MHEFKTHDEWLDTYDYCAFILPRSGPLHYDSLTFHVLLDIWHEFVYPSEHFEYNAGTMAVDGPRRAHGIPSIYE